MSINKNALIRYQVLDRCFRNTGRMYFWDDLLEECNKALMDFDPNSEGIQRRQLFDDIRFMESEAGWSVPLGRIRHGRKVYYRYEDLSFSISNQPLNDSEAEQIKSALQIFSRFSGTPQFEWVNEMIPMLESKFGLIERKSEIISFESNIDLKGLHFLTPLFNAIVNERVLLVKYKDFKSSEPYEITFHPYYLKQYNNRWFVFGLNSDNQVPNWNLALDRIEFLSETALKYKPSATDWEEYFFDLVGVTRSEGVELQEIVLKFSPEVAPYVITKPIHPSQKHKNDPTGLEVKIKVIPNFELERLILSFGEQVKVNSPQDFKERIFQRLKSAGHLY
ncbi:WYL domain-containing protein [Sphingobacterium sp. WM]|uniref:helix-turn-helix transcriptional regulator n=1 Tax=Sphingobacterium sp. WM TaxID=3031802 RepID=UPI00240D3303|nr:WYL domain-containing protein [Sphingobacterium sp. WM]WFB65023.1 WYL domain-containing protein [Sphingobacterium sp. WM]